ncbi:MAG: ubiquinone/menaquinone biosynthesis methyltransferase [Elusimicrobia bacterium]|nr:ubiquinone/menaquinone biosynthesis methyltransferase [Elusimicrobiota bacterium]MBP9128435.1 ubiquinone/menaquinone biosynthesis methyltransferase [Elusimicrobiota bacterium]
MFSGLAGRYRVFNRLSSLGLDRQWRRTLVENLGPHKRVLDVGTGTGDLAREMLERYPAVQVVGVDVSSGMIAEGGRIKGPSPQWVQASAERLPFVNGSFGAVVSAFVLRNLFMGGILKVALQELSRVLEPGGRLVFLDLTRPSNVFVRWGRGLYGRTILPMIGRSLFGKNWPGSYLESSIRSLPSPQELSELFLANGFIQFECQPLWGGVVSLFIGKK